MERRRMGKCPRQLVDNGTGPPPRAALPNRKKPLRATVLFTGFSKGIYRKRWWRDWNPCYV